MNIKINTHGNPMPEQHGEWIDLCVAHDEVLRKGDYKILSLGISMQLPVGYYAEVVPRSSTCKYFSILMANSVGIVENDYNGDDDIWGFPAYAIEDTIIPRGSRICQFRLVKQAPTVEFTQVDVLGNENRGGFGSTGRRCVK